MCGRPSADERAAWILPGTVGSALAAPLALGTLLGRFLGKQLTIFAFTALAVRLSLAPMPGRASAVNFYGVSVIAGIGFTMALFIAALALAGAPEHLERRSSGSLQARFSRVWWDISCFE